MKVKRSKYTGSVKARPHPLFVALIVVLVVGLGFVGYVSYEPIYNAIMNAGSRGEPDPEPDPQPVQTQPDPDPGEGETLPVAVTGLKSVYVPPQLMLDAAALSRFLDGLEGTGINAVLVDIKDKQGQVLFSSGNQKAREWGVIASGAVDLASLGQVLADRGLALMVRLSVFRDESAARADESCAVNYRAPGTLWLDNFPEQGGKPWLNPYSAAARRYITDLALEAADCGAAYIVLDDCHFPPNSLTGDAYFGETGGVERTQLLAGFVAELEEAAAAKGARVGTYLSAMALAAGPNLTTFGGEPREILGGNLVLGALPYQFNDGYDTERFSISRPLENPAATVKQIAVFAKEQVAGKEILALIQGGNEPNSETGYTARQIAAQADALADVEIAEYILYCTDPAAYQLTVEN